VEKLLEPVRHVEVQIIADRHGNVFAIGERECSMQRRFQKILEEAPSPVVDEKLRARMLAAARKLAAAAGYVNAGTVEFLLGPDKHFYFLEMNTRLQVEHPVTEFVTGLDLVRLQVEVARGEKLSLPELPPRGHSIEARIYAENPDAGFLPTSGELLRLAWPEGVRVDHGLAEGGEVSPHYDPLIAKVISWGPDREHARRRLVNALKGTVLLGVPTNLNFLIALLETREFREGDMSTGSLPEVGETEITPAVWAAAATVRPKRKSKGSAVSPFDRLGHWRVGP
jgi:acetyl/propionyl-CoA carboxylase alpha subunit